MFGFTLYQSACVYASVTAFSATWVALALPIQHGKVGPFNYHRAIKRDALAASPPKVSAVAVSPSSQDDRGFTRGEESFTIITSSPLILRNVATSADVLRHDRSLHASSHFL
ncbi:hypothetical protein Q7P36_011420 [Cladosporium allicinum]